MIIARTCGVCLWRPGEQFMREYFCSVSGWRDERPHFC